MTVDRLTFDAIGDVALEVRVVLGSTSVRVADVLAFAPGSIVPLEAAPDAPVAILVNGVAIAAGDIVVDDDGTLAVEIAELYSPAGGRT